MLSRDEVGAVVVLLEGLAAQHPDDPLSAVAVRVAEALHGRVEDEADTGLDPEHDQGPRRDSDAVAEAGRRRKVGRSRDMAAEARDDAAEGRDERAAVRAAQAVESAQVAEASAERMLELLRLAELRDDRAAGQPIDRRTPEQQRSDEEDRASNRVDRAALRAFLLTLRVDREAEGRARHADAQNRFAARRDRTAARVDREAAEDDREQALVDIEELAERLNWTRQNIISIIKIIERAERLDLTKTDPAALGELEAIARKAARSGD
ncbi:hypothetical protein J4573_35890 [Actinomadura barringtoniae]|uniref:Uncharacterized protein n=1 Tax=Actinomadura barringtoniae TaxID=1427535 RepID=A0A939PH30_9ACTN|nr:hypothetical protein [Actinomadura barringtoniae]MBO2452520.1 hypothetical protein [Actinomadura barringtoniae]